MQTLRANPIMQQLLLFFILTSLLSCGQTNQPKKIIIEERESFDQTKPDQAPYLPMKFAKTKLWAKADHERAAEV
jgi:hypothetical protein